jgi:hypothetical protein
MFTTLLLSSGHVETPDPLWLLQYQLPESTFIILLPGNDCLHVSLCSGFQMSYDSIYVFICFDMIVNCSLTLVEET